MKKNITLTSLVIGMASTLVLFSGCNKPTERPAVVNSKIASKLYAISDLAEVTSSANAVLVQGGEKDLKLMASAKVTQTKLEGSKALEILKKVTEDASKKALDEQLKTGAVALVVLADQIKILKVVAEVNNNIDTNISSLSYFGKLKALSKAVDAKAQADLVSELETLKYKSPADLNESFGLVEITSIAIQKYGVLDNEKNDYNEKKSLLNIIDKPFEVSTHILVGEEVGSKAAAEAKAAEAKAAATQSKE